MSLWDGSLDAESIVEQRLFCEEASSPESVHESAGFCSFSEYVVVECVSESGQLCSQSICLCIDRSREARQQTGQWHSFDYLSGALASDTH